MLRQELLDRDVREELPKVDEPIDAGDPGAQGSAARIHELDDGARRRPQLFTLMLAAFVLVTGGIKAGDRTLLPGLGPNERALVNYFAIYPNFLLTLHPDYMVTVTIWPETVDRTRLISEWHFHPDEIARPGFVYEDAVEFWDITNREDWAISERAQQGIASRGYVPGPYSNRDRQLWEFDQFILSRVGDKNE